MADRSSDTKSPACTGPLDRLQAAEPLAQRSELLVHVVVGDRGVVDAHRDAVQRRKGDLGTDVHLGGEADRLTLGAGDVDLGLADRLQAVLPGRLDVASRHDLVDGLLQDGRPADPLVDDAGRHLARSEARHPDLRGDLLVRRVEAGLDLLRRHLDGEPDAGRAQVLGGALHVQVLLKSVSRRLARSGRTALVREPGRRSGRVSGVSAAQSIEPPAGSGRPCRVIKTARTTPWCGADRVDHRRAALRRGGGIRTHGPSLPKRVRYQAAPHPGRRSLQRAQSTGHARTGPHHRGRTAGSAKVGRLCQAIAADGGPTIHTCPLPAPESSSPAPRCSPAGSPTATGRGWPNSCAFSASTWPTWWSSGTGPRTSTPHCASRCGSGVDLVLTSGGLGPTADDLTADVVAAFQDRPMVVDEALEQRITDIVARLSRGRGWRMAAEATAAATRKQARVPRGARVLEPVGTAPGLVVPAAEGTAGPPGRGAARSTVRAAGHVGTGRRRPGRRCRARRAPRTAAGHPAPVGRARVGAGRDPARARGSAGRAGDNNLSARRRARDRHPLRARCAGPLLRVSNR